VNLGGQQTYTLALMRAMHRKGWRVALAYIHGSDLLGEFRAVGDVHRLPLPIFNKSRFGIGRIVNRSIYWTFGAVFLIYLCLRHNYGYLVTASTPDSINGNRTSSIAGTRHFRFLGGSLKQVEPHWLSRWKRLRLDDKISGYFGHEGALLELLSVGVSKEKLRVLGMAVDTQRHFPLPVADRIEFRRSLGIADDELVIGWIGRTNQNMQVWETVSLCRMLIEKGFTHFKLLIVGGGDDFNLLVKTVESSGLVNRSILTGWVPYDKINSYINSMDIVPLLEADPHGGSIVRETMATGRVALSVDGPSRVQSTFMAGDHAVLVDTKNYLENAAEAVIRLAERPSRLREIGELAEKYARLNMSFDAVSEDFIRALDLSG